MAGPQTKDVRWPDPKGIVQIGSAQAMELEAPPLEPQTLPAPTPEATTPISFTQLCSHGPKLFGLEGGTGKVYWLSWPGTGQKVQCVLVFDPNNPNLIPNPST